METIKEERWGRGREREIVVRDYDLALIVDIAVEPYDSSPMILRWNSP